MSDFLLQFAGVPLLGDLSRVYRAKGYDEARKHEPLADLMDELERLIPSRYLQDLAPGAPPTYHKTHELRKSKSASGTIPTRPNGFPSSVASLRPAW